jgi:hypothetical protein
MLQNRNPFMKFTAFYIVATLAFVSCKKSRDNTNTITSNTISTSCASEYDVDIALSDTFSFIDDYNDPWDYGAPNPDEYYDLTQVIGTGLIPPFGEFNIYVIEYADTAALNDTVVESYFLIAKGNIDPTYIQGYTSINFKRLISQGGGLFNGTFTVTGGSAYQCDGNVFANLPPLIVTGSLDVTTHMAILTIKGKVYF